MKRLIAAVILTLLIIGACVAGGITVRSICEKALGIISDCEKACDEEDWQSAERLSRRAEDEWHSSQELLAVFVDHGLLDGVSEAVAHLPPYAKEKSAAEYRSECAAAVRLLRQIVDEQGFSAQSFY